MSGSGYDWYVGSVNGSDSNPGTQAAPFQTIAKLLTVYAAGQSVGLERGSTWREKITIGAAGDIWNGNSIHAYGTGSAPKIHCDDIIPAESWTKTGGQTNVWQATITKDYSASEPCTYAAWVNDAQLIKATSLANCDATVGSCFAVNYDANSDMTFYIHSTGSSDPTSDGKTVEVAVRHSAVYGFYSTNLIVDGIETRRNFSLGGSIKVGAGANIRNCTLRQGSSHSMYVVPSATVDSCTFIDCYNGAAGCTMLNYNDNVAAGGNVTVTDNVFTMITANIAAGPMNGHNNVSGTFGTITLTNNTYTGFTNTGVMFACNHAAAIVMTNPTFVNSYGISSPALAAGGAGCTMTVTGGTWTNSVAGQRGVNVSAASVPISITGMTFNVDATTITGCVFLGANSTLSITNCTFKSSLGAGNRFAIYAQACATGNLTLNNNTYNTGTGSWTYHYAFTANASGVTWASDNNAFEATNDAWSIFGNVYSTLADYQAAVTPRDANSTSS